MRHRRNHCAWRQPRSAGAVRELRCRRWRIEGRTPAGSRPIGATAAPPPPMRPNSHCCTAGSPSSISIRVPTSRWRPRMAATCSFSTAKSTITSSCARLLRATAMSSAPPPTARCSSRPMRIGARRRCSGSPACTPSSCSTANAGNCSWPVIPSASSRCLCARGSGHLAFASEIGPLLDVPGVGRSIDHARTCLFLSVGVTDEGSEPCSPMSAACRRETSRALGSMHRRSRRWRSGGRRSRCGTAVPRRRRLDVREALFRSRAAAPAQQRADRHRPVRRHRLLRHHRVRPGAAGLPSIFTASASPPPPDVDETPWVDMVGAAAGTERHMVRIEPGELVADLDRLIDTQDEPFSSPSVYAQHRVLGLAREHGIKVLLDGQGADEMLAGYRPYLAGASPGCWRRSACPKRSGSCAPWPGSPAPARGWSRRRSSRGVAAAARSRAARGRAAAVAALDRRPMVRRQGRVATGRPLRANPHLSTMRWCRAYRDLCRRCCATRTATRWPSASSRGCRS